MAKVPSRASGVAPGSPLALCLGPEAAPGRGPQRQIRPPPEGPMPTATTIVRRAAVRADRIADTVSLDHAAREAVAGSLVAEGGLGFAVALTKAAPLEDGDALRLDDGRLVAVRAAAEDLLEVRAENPARLMRLAWQLGGSHVPSEIATDVLYVP